MRRVLVTGSRDWSDLAAVWRAIAAEYTKGDITVVHGDCPTGADHFAHQWFSLDEDEGFSNFATEERHPADWERACDESCHHKPRTKNGKPYCPMAGHLRNQKMVDLGADVCLAFPLPDSRGTIDCIRRARAADIPVIVHQAEVPA